MAPSSWRRGCRHEPDPGKQCGPQGRISTSFHSLEHQDILVESSRATCSLPPFPHCKRILLACLAGMCRMFRRAPFSPPARLRQDSSCVITSAGTDSLWPRQLWCCRVAPPAVSRGALSSCCPQRWQDLSRTGLALVPVLLHGCHPSVPHLPHLGSQAFSTMWSAKPQQRDEQRDHYSHGPPYMSPPMGMAPEQLRAPGLL